MPNKVIVNSTPIIVLCGIGRLNVLQKLYGEIIIPSAVYQEVTLRHFKVRILVALLKTGLVLLENRACLA